MLLIILLLILFLILGGFGFAIHGLLWLAILAIICFIIVAITGGIRRF